MPKAQAELPDSDLIIPICVAVVARAAMYGYEFYVPPATFWSSLPRLWGARWLRDRVNGRAYGSKKSRLGQVEILFGSRSLRFRASEMSPNSLEVTIFPDTPEQMEELRDVVVPKLQRQVPNLAVVWLRDHAGVKLALERVGLFTRGPRTILNQL